MYCFNVTLTLGECPFTLSQYITSHSDQLSLAIPPWIGAMSTSQRTVMPCSWGWQVKLYDSLAITSRI